MRILLVRDRFTPTSPPEVAASTLLLSQLVRQATEAGHSMRELVPNVTDTDKGPHQFRAAMRLRLDAEVSDYDPQVIHVQGVGLLGHLALETGVPYLILTFGEELAASLAGSTVRADAQQAIENAGRIVVDTPQAREQILTAFGEIDTIIVADRLAEFSSSPEAAEGSGDAGGPSLDWLWAMYCEIVARRRRSPGRDAGE
ncbi:MAG TPA: hypothetical protein VHC22_13590 [Pirellulales bacterium]|nr:hypothetical protein [Pirellulales bacterium]